MPVGMHHRLPRRLTTVQADVETADGGIRQRKILLSLLQQCSDGIPLELMQRHSIGHMPVRIHRTMAAALKPLAGDRSNQKAQSIPSSCFSIATSAFLLKLSKGGGGG